MAINDVLPLKVDRRDAIANLKYFRASDTRDLISMVTFTFTMRRQLIRLASAPFISSHSATFGWFRVQRLGSTMQNLQRVSENSDHILSRLWTNVHEIFRRCRKPLVLSNALFRLSMSRFVQKTFAIKSQSRRKTEQMQKFFDPQFLWAIRLASAPFISSRLATFGLVRFPCATLGKHNAELRRVGDNYFKPFFQTIKEAPCTFQHPFPIVCVRYRSEDIRH